MIWKIGDTFYVSDYSEKQINKYTVKNSYEDKYGCGVLIADDDEFLADYVHHTAEAAWREYIEEHEYRKNTLMERYLEEVKRIENAETKLMELQSAKIHI